MIKIDGYRVKIAGDVEDLFENLLNLHVAIMQDPGLMEINQAAMEAAVEVIKEKAFEIRDVKSFKVAWRDMTDEYRKKQDDIHENNEG